MNTKQGKICESVSTHLHRQTMAERNKMIEEIEYCTNQIRTLGGDSVIEKRLRLSFPNIKT